MAVLPRCSARHRLFFALGLLCAACRTAPPPEPPAPAPPPTAPPTKPNDPRAPDPDAIVATVDGIPLREAELAALARIMQPAPPRAALVLALVERRLVEREAEGLGIRVLEHEIDQSVGQIASSNGMTIEQLREAVVEATALSWQEYRIEVAHQLLETKVLRPLIPPIPNADAQHPDAWIAVLEGTRARLVGCLRARTEITVHDPSVALPQNAFAIFTTVTGFRFLDDTVLPAAELEAAAKPLIEERSLCDSLPAAELAMQQLYLDRGYLDAHVRIPWPDQPQATMPLDVHTTAGELHRIGELRFDQSAVPAARRLRERDLRRQLRVHVEPGDTAAMPTVQAATEAIRAVFEAAGLGPMEVDVTRREVDDGVRVDLTFRLLGARA